MTTFETPRPIHVDFSMAAGSAHVTASERTDTVVEVVPVDPSKVADVQAAQDTRVEFDSSFNVASGDVHLADVASVAVKSASGDVSVDRVLGHADIATASGDIRVQYIGGSASVRTASGDAILGLVAGDLRLKSVSGDATVRRA